MRNYFKHRRLLLLICTFPFLLSGCWDRIEINDMAIIVATGIDLTDEGEVELSVQIVNPQGLGGSGSGGGQLGGSGSVGTMVSLEKATGKTIYDARSKLQEKVPRSLFLGHNRVILIGERLAKQGIKQHVDFFARHPFPRIKAYVFVTKDKPIELLQVNPDLERSTAEAARELADQKFGLDVTLKDLLQMLAEDTRGAALPYLLVDKELPGKVGLKVNGSAIFSNGKLIGELDDEINRGLLWLINKVDQASVTIEPEAAAGYISFSIINAKTKMKPTINNGKWKMTIDIQADDDIVENNTYLDVMSPAILKKLEGQLGETIRHQIYDTLEVIQKDFKTDVLGFDEAFHSHYPKEWATVKDNWADTFSEVDVEVNTKISISRPGRSTTPQGVPKDKVIE
ncbi:Ger(x)C family spore germination protein [Ornithinibacillus bavariensis]|uniref:Ger(x)C family spore germination protein n=1 Tax=Ornithinibacillus bavariensis TaxID=545502 RepID=UPI000EC18F0F|nr:Ger(x)C family spore germination protein [Ornithinibacillus sp.]